MNKQEAAQVIEDLIKGVMAGGGFKDFVTIDKCREALTVLAQESNDKE